MATKKTKNQSKNIVAKTSTEKTVATKNNSPEKKITSIDDVIKSYLADKNNKVFIANWKMNKKFEDIKSFFTHFNELIKKDNVLKHMNNLIGIAPSAIGLLPTAGMAKNGVVTVAQYVRPEKNGAFTGCISYDQVREYNINYAIVGHSESRKLFNLSENDVNVVVRTLLENNMIPVLCIGDTLEEYESKQSERSITRQLLNDLKGILPELVKNTIIAYEPIWAIGKKAATVPQIQRMTTFIRKTIREMFDSKIAEDVHVLYGGSVKVENAMDILKVKGLDGFLIGGASLNPESFYEIIISSQEYSRVNSIVNLRKIARAHNRAKREKGKK